MSKKHYFILSPGKIDEELVKKVDSYYGQKDYEHIAYNLDYQDTLTKAITDENIKCNAKLMLIGSSIMAMSMSDSVYVTKNWEEDDYCKLCHAIAFSYGLDIVYES